MKYLIRLSLPILLILLLVNTSTPVYAQQVIYGKITLASVLDYTTAEFNQGVSDAVISNDGRYIAFMSASTNVVPNDTNNADDVFVYDRQTQRIEIIPRTGANGATIGIFAMSGDGRYVVFSSLASNLIPTDTNNTVDVFVYDRQLKQTKRVSVRSGGSQVNNGFGSLWVDISSDGRYIVFDSPATNLVLNDTNNQDDVFLHDIQTGTTTRVSVDSNGNQAISGGGYPQISDDGRYVMFTSDSSNLVANDTNNQPDVFVRDLQTGQTTRVSLDSNGNQSLSNAPMPITIGEDISADGRYITFTSNADNLVANDTNGDAWDQFLHDRQTGQTIRVSVDSNGNQSNGLSGGGRISDDGRYVFFESQATNLVLNDTNNVLDGFMYDTQTGVTTRISVDSLGNQANGISGSISVSSNMQYMSFISASTNLAPNDNNASSDMFIHDRQNNTLRRIGEIQLPIQHDQHAEVAAISGDGKRVFYRVRDWDPITGGIGALWMYDSNLNRSINLAVSLEVSYVSTTYDGSYITFRMPIGRHWHVYLMNVQTGQITRITALSPDSNRYYATESPSISADGRYISFSTTLSLVPEDTNGNWANQVADVYVYDTQTGKFTLLTANRTSSSETFHYSGISSNGRYVVYIDRFYKIFVHDIKLGVREAVNVNSNEEPAMYGSSFIAIDNVSEVISGDGCRVVFASTATNLTLNDTNEKKDIFLRDRCSGETKLISISSQGEQANADSDNPYISDDGTTITFFTSSTNLTPQAGGEGDKVISYYIPTNQFIYPAPAISFMSDDGRRIAFSSTETSLVDNDLNGKSDVFIQEVTMPFSSERLKLDEQTLFNMAQMRLTDGMTFALFDITPTGILTTIQFSDGAVVTGNIQMRLQNGLITMTVNGLSGGTVAQQNVVNQQVPSLMMSLLDDLLPDDFAMMDSFVLTDTSINVTMIYPNNP